MGQLRWWARRWHFRRRKCWLERNSILLALRLSRVLPRARASWASRWWLQISGCRRRLCCKLAPATNRLATEMGAAKSPVAGSSDAYVYLAEFGSEEARLALSAATDAP